LLDAQEAVTTLEFLRDEGKIKAWGVSNFTPSQLRLVATQQIPEWNQIECSLAHTTPLTDGTLDTHQTPWGSDDGVGAAGSAIGQQ
tara:strand:+ start:8857 stop:9114 length:258 start_codon:yes stop_codon:yes gene_type:complete